MERVTVNAHAKLNLTLEVTGREGAFHTLDSLAVSLDLCDVVRAVRRPQEGVSVVMRGMGCEHLPPQENNAVRAAEMFFAAFPQAAGADIAVEKHIPVGGGLGGSSADAAGVLLALSRLFGVKKEELLPLARALGSDTAMQLFSGAFRMRALGSDTAMQLFSGAFRMQGRGERLAPVAGMPKLYFVLLCPEGGISSAACFSAFDALGGCGSSGMTARAIARFSAGEVEAAAKECKNDLLPAACSLDPAVGEAMNAARSLSPLAAGMTGSGSTVFALFGGREARDRALERIQQGKFTALAAESIQNEE